MGLERRVQSALDTLPTRCVHSGPSCRYHIIENLLRNPTHSSNERIRLRLVLAPSTAQPRPKFPRLGNGETGAARARRVRYIGRGGRGGMKTQRWRRCLGRPRNPGACRMKCQRHDAPNLSKTNRAKMANGIMKMMN